VFISSSGQYNIYILKNVNNLLNEIQVYKILQQVVINIRAFDSLIFIITHAIIEFFFLKNLSIKLKFFNFLEK